MKRKETLLEKKLIENNYRLKEKTYTGKNSDKVDNYIYSYENGETEFFVNLDKTREHIVYYSFNNSKFYKYDLGKIESLKYVFDSFEEFLKSIYDFKERRAKE